MLPMRLACAILLTSWWSLAAGPPPLLLLALLTSPSSSGSGGVPTPDTPLAVRPEACAAAAAAANGEPSASGLLAAARAKGVVGLPGNSPSWSARSPGWAPDAAAKSAAAC